MFRSIGLFVFFMPFINLIDGAYCLAQFETLSDGQEISIGELIDNFDNWEHALVQKLVSSRELREQFDISDSQAEELVAEFERLEKELKLEMPRWSKEEIAAFSTEDHENAMTERVEVLNKFSKQRNKVFETVLTPGQVKSIHEHFFWSIVNRTNEFYKLFLIPKVAEASGVSESDLRSLSSEYGKLESEYQVKAAELRNAYRIKFLKLLEQKQRESFIEKFGEPQGDFPRFPF